MAYADSHEVEAAVLKRFSSNPGPIEFVGDFGNMNAENTISKNDLPKHKIRQHIYYRVQQNGI